MSINSKIANYMRAHMDRNMQAQLLELMADLIRDGEPEHISPIMKEHIAAIMQILLVETICGD